MYCLYRKNQNDPVITLEAITCTHEAAEEIRNDMSARQQELRFAIVQSFTMPHFKIDLRELVDILDVKDVKEVEKTFYFR